MKEYKSSQIFVPGGMPLHTYVARSEGNLENKLRSATDNLCKLVQVGVNKMTIKSSKNLIDYKA